jgi:allantoin racemase
MRMTLRVADHIAIISILKNVVPLARASVAKSGLERRVVSVRDIDVPILDLRNHTLLFKDL